MKTLRFRAATPRNEHHAVRQTVGVAPFLELLAFFICLVCFLCAGAQASVEPSVAESPITESPVDPQESAREGDGEADVTSHASQQRKRSDASSSWKRTLREPGRAKSAAPGPLGIFGPRLFVAPTLLLSSDVVRQDAHACIAQLFLSSVPPRGPTLIG